MTRSKELTPDEVLEILEKRRKIRNTAGRISHDLCVKEDAQIYERYWSGRDDVSLTLNAGTYSGKKAVEAYYEACGEEIELTSKLIAEKFPEAFEGKTKEELYGVGMINYTPVDSHVIEIAGDGQSAKALFNVRGSYCYLTPSGPVANWTYGYMAMDLISEDGEYKIWHMQLLYNVDNPCGVNFISPGKNYEPVEGFEKIAEFKMPEPNAGKEAEHYHPFRQHQITPEVPEPYETFEDTFSYGL